jgi:hypothetical protein
MNEKVQKQFEQALAYVHAALDNDNVLNMAQVRRTAERVLRRVPLLTMEEARHVYQHASELRALLRILDGGVMAEN